MAAKRQKRLRQGYTTGACAAAAAKAAAMQVAGQPAPTAVEIPFPDGSRHRLAIHQLRAATPAHEAMDTPGDREEPEADGHGFTATVIKDAGDDPDVTNGAAITATVWKLGSDPNFPTGADPDAVFQPYEGTGEDQPAGLWLARGTGVGVVTKPGLAIAPGEAAINPVPRRMIAAAVAEVWAGAVPPPLLVTIAVADGQRLANKTLNHRLGIVGGLSILGTTGIVRPVSAEAWTATIEAALDVARAAGLEEVVLATGRTSEKGVMNRLQLPPEAGVMMGDYLQFTLQAAGRRGFSRLHLAGMWAKLVKAARGVPQTHVRHGVVDVEQAVALLAELAAAGGEKMPAGLAAELATAHTVREIYDKLTAAKHLELIRAVCGRAGEYAAATAGLPVTVHLVDSRARVVLTVEGDKR